MEGETRVRGAKFLALFGDGCTDSSFLEVMRGYCCLSILKEFRDYRRDFF